MTTELERLKILGGKISQLIDRVNGLIGENEKLKQQIKELRAEKKHFEEIAKKAGQLDEDLKSYEQEKEAIKEKIETIISQIDQVGI